jgi:thioredoxin reductase (NADPH)
MLDCLIVGGGPAGLTAAIYLARFRRDLLLIDAGHSRAALIPATHNYPGFMSIDGRALLERLRRQAAEHGAKLIRGEVRSLARRSHGFIASTTEGEISARTLLLATGLVDGKPPIKGFADDGYAGPVRFCPICDGFEALDKRVGVVGDAETAYRKACFMRTYSKDITLFPIDDANARLQESIADAGIRLAGKPSTIVRERHRVAVTTTDGVRHELDVLYPALGSKVNSELAVALGASCDPTGMIHVDAHQRTNVAGLYAAGDVVTDLHQIAVATAHAAVAATHIHNSLAPNPR